MLEICRSRLSAMNDLFKVAAVLRMDAPRHGVQGRLGSFVFEDAVGFIRPDSLTGVRFPSKTSRATQPLRLRQICFASAKFLGQNLVLCNVDGAADILFQLLPFCRGSADAPYVPDLAARTHDPLYGVERRTFRQD